MKREGEMRESFHFTVNARLGFIESSNQTTDKHHDRKSAFVLPRKSSGRRNNSTWSVCDIALAARKFTAYKS